MLSSIFARAPSLPASELPVPSSFSSEFPLGLALRQSQSGLEQLSRLLPLSASLWPTEEDEYEG